MARVTPCTTAFETPSVRALTLVSPRQRALEDADGALDSWRIGGRRERSSLGG
jgi:hypothetical protein